jgi:hypothetical protein
LAPAQTQVFTILSTICSLSSNNPYISAYTCIPQCIHTLCKDNSRMHQKLGFLKFREFYRQDLRHCRNFDASMRSSSRSLPQNISSIMLKRSIPIMLKKLSINTPKDIHKNLSIDPQKGFSPNVHFTRDPSFLFILSSSRSLNPFLGHLTYFPYFRVNHFP